MDVTVIIPSRKRVNVIEEGALKLFPKATVCVAESEREDYAFITNNLLTHPDAVVGMGPLRQWILDHVVGECVFMVDDDTHALYALVGERARRITSTSDIAAIVTQTAQNAKDAGAHVFGFNQAWDVRKFLPMKPFALTGWIGGSIGIIGRDLTFAPELKLRVDIDYCLQSLLKHRIIWQDLRFAFAQRRFEGKGGNAVARSSEAHEREIAYLQKKWGGYLGVRKTKTAIRLLVRVPRSRTA